MGRAKRKALFLLLREFPPRFHGGAPIIIYELFLRLKQLPLIISTSRADDPDGRELFEDAEIHRHPYLPTMVDPDYGGWPQPFRFALRYLAYLRWNLAVLRIGMRRPIGCVFLARYDYAYPAAVLLSRLKRVPLISLFYGEEWSMVSCRATADWKLHSLFFPSFVRSVDLLLLASESARQDLVQAGLLDGGLVLPPGVDTERLRPPEDKDRLRRKHAPGADLLLLSLARLTERKGQDRVIEAFAALHEKYPGARLVIAGSGPTGERLEQLARDLGLEQKVRFTGELPYTSRERVELFQAADIFLMPNRRSPLNDLEGFGIVFLEANACGVPVIGGNDGGVPEAIAHGRSGFVVDARTPGPVTDVLDRLMGDAVLRERLGAQGRQRVVDDFSWERMAERFEAALDGLTGEGR